MNPSTALAQALVDELVRGGVREAVLSPGSRNAPLSYALAAADADGRLRLHVRVDERTGGFLALGLAKASGVPVPVVCTSGTAAANLHPAVLEASHSGVPLLVLTADRPPELQGTGANQTVDQLALYGGAVRARHLLAAADGGPGDQATWRSLTCRALATASGRPGGDPGPVHVDVALRDPLVPGDDGAQVEPAGGRADGGPWTRVDGPAGVPSDVATDVDTADTLMVVGDTDPATGHLAAEVAARHGWPLVAEPTSGAGSGALPHGVLLLGDTGFLGTHRPRRVVVVGRPTLARAVQRLLADPALRVDVVAPFARWPDPSRRATAVHPVSWLHGLLVAPPIARPGWRDAWEDASRRAAVAVDEVLAGAWPSGPRVARDLVAALPAGSLLTLGSSSPVRDVDVAATVRDDLRVLANRGVAGIDGTVSTAIGAALSVGQDRPAYALMGDLTFLHDATGLVIGPDEPRPDLTIVVVDDDGGAIFGQLEQGAPELAGPFERIFGTPTGTDLGALCAATRTPYVDARTPQELIEALRPGSGIRVVRVAVDRSKGRALSARLRAAVAMALG